MKYYDFLNIFFRDKVDKFFLYQFNNYKISLIFKKKLISIYYILYYKISFKY